VGPRAGGFSELTNPSVVFEVARARSYIDDPERLHSPIDLVVPRECELQTRLGEEGREPAVLLQAIVSLRCCEEVLADLEHSVALELVAPVIDDLQMLDQREPVSAAGGGREPGEVARRFCAISRGETERAVPWSLPRIRSVPAGLQRILRRKLPAVAVRIGVDASSLIIAARLFRSTTAGR
jgi:hypothetical protein